MGPSSTRDASAGGHPARPASPARSTASSVISASRLPSSSRISSSKVPARTASSHRGGATALHSRSPSTSARPAFSTFQQAFTPSAPPPPPPPATRTAETARAQAELLRLHLLHRDAAATHAAWTASACAMLGARFAAVVGAAQAAATCAERDNAAALVRWAGGHEDRLQALDAVVAAVWAAGEPGSRFARVAGRFERWAAVAAETCQARRRPLPPEQPQQSDGAGQAEGAGTTPWIEPLGQAWAQDRIRVVSRLEAARVRLRGLPVPDQEKATSVGRVVAACTELLDGMLVELDGMAALVEDVGRMEDEWVRTTLLAPDEEGDDQSVTAGAIWRAL